MDIRDVVIIGAGPAGIATAIQLKRHRINPAFLEQDEIGGLLRNANEVENYPGFPGGISGADLVERFKEHLEDAEIKVCFEKVLELDCRNGLFITRTGKRTIQSKYAVVATGTKPKKNLDFPVSNNSADRFFREVYPLRETSNKKIVIIGAGDAAFDYALTMSNNNKVTILNRGQKTRCIPVLRERCFESESIAYRQNTEVREIRDKGATLSVVCTCTGSTEPNTGAGSDRTLLIEADYIIAATGREPCLDFFSGSLKKNIEKLHTIDKLYIVGDVKNDRYRQTAICVGDGVMAAMKIHNNLGETAHEDTGQNGN